MKKNPIYYDEALDLFHRLNRIAYTELADLCDYKSETEIMLALGNLYKLLQAYIQVTDDLKELQEVSE